MINRFQYMAKCTSDISHALLTDKAVVEQCIKSGGYYTVALFLLDNALYMYCETEQTADAAQLFPALTDMPGCDGWRLMDNVYYTNIPVSAGQWHRNPGKERLCRIGRLMPDKIESYIKYHKLYMEEGIRTGDKYLCIGLLDGMLFLYYESPEEETCLRPDKSGESWVQKEWIKKDPPGHFDHSFSGEGNFINMKSVFSMGREDFEYE